MNLSKSFLSAQQWAARLKLWSPAPAWLLECGLTVQVEVKITVGEPYVTSLRSTHLQ